MNTGVISFSLLVQTKSSLLVPTTTSHPIVEKHLSFLFGCLGSRSMVPWWCLYCSSINQYVVLRWYEIFPKRRRPLGRSRVVGKEIHSFASGLVVVGHRRTTAAALNERPTLKRTKASPQALSLWIWICIFHLWARTTIVSVVEWRRNSCFLCHACLCR